MLREKFVPSIRESVGSAYAVEGAGKVTTLLHYRQLWLLVTGWGGGVGVLLGLLTDFFLVSYLGLDLSESASCYYGQLQALMGLLNWSSELKTVEEFPCLLNSRSHLSLSFSLSLSSPLYSCFLPSFIISSDSVLLLHPG